MMQFWTKVNKIVNYALIQSTNSLYSYLYNSNLL